MLCEQEPMGWQHFSCFLVSQRLPLLGLPASSSSSGSSWENINVFYYSLWSELYRISCNSPFNCSAGREKNLYYLRLSVPLPCPSQGSHLDGREPEMSCGRRVDIMGLETAEHEHDEANVCYHLAKKLAGNDSVDPWRGVHCQGRGWEQETEGRQWWKQERNYRKCFGNCVAVV